MILLFTRIEDQLRCMAVHEQANPEPGVQIPESKPQTQSNPGSESRSAHDR